MLLKNQGLADQQKHLQHVLLLGKSEHSSVLRRLTLPDDLQQSQPRLDRVLTGHGQSNQTRSFQCCVLTGATTGRPQARCHAARDLSCQGTETDRWPHRLVCFPFFFSE